jgi:alkanesulfonate monooxygenase SsuD/methylene tetrahydromethanopterin reductase-like flavin-dependent oxidoreductase (luciferase family)
MLKMAVGLPGDLTSAGEFLADARALETAGTETVWLEPGPDDPWMLAAAVATVTSRVSIGMTADRETPALLARLRTLMRFSPGRVVLLGDGPDLERVANLARAAGGCRIFGAAADERDWRRIAAVADGLRFAGANAEDDCGRLERVVTLAAGASRAGPFEVWVDLKVPDDRVAWRRTLTTYAAAGATGLVFPFDARLVDLLRRSDEEDDRSDLGLAQG